MNKYGTWILIIIITVLLFITGYKSIRLKKLITRLMKNKHKEELKELNNKRAKLKGEVSAINVKRLDKMRRFNDALRKYNQR